MNELCRFADDTYLIIPEMNVESRSAVIDHINTLALKNNLMLNRKKSIEIVFADTRKKRQVAAAPPLPVIPSITLSKVFGVTVTNILVVVRSCPWGHR